MKKIKPSETLAQQAYKIIKEAIISNKFKPTEELVEEQIANQLGISRTPIRTAFSQLAFEGLVEMETGKRARVSSLSIEDVEDCQFLREALEPLAAQLAAKETEPEQIALLEEIIQKQRKSTAEDDLFTFLELDIQFHVTLAKYSKNVKLKEFIEILNNQVQRFLILSNTLQVSATGAIEEHAQIIQALKEKNAAKAKENMLLHVQNVTKRILA